MVAISAVVGADIVAAMPMTQTVRAATANADPVPVVDARALGRRPASGSAGNRGRSFQFMATPRTARNISPHDIARDACRMTRMDPSMRNYPSVMCADPA